jgi:uncharacterized protein
MSMDPVVHFELPANDRKRMVQFYTKAFGWKCDVLGEDMGHYVTVQTSEIENGRQMPSTIGGGFFTKTDEMPADIGPTIVIAVKDINASMDKIKKSGGKILGEPMEIPKIGMYVSFIDTEGNRVGMLQPQM